MATKKTKVSRYTETLLIDMRRTEADESTRKAVLDLGVRLREAEG